MREKTRIPFDVPEDNNGKLKIPSFPANAAQHEPRDHRTSVQTETPRFPKRFADMRQQLLRWFCLGVVAAFPELNTRMARLFVGILVRPRLGVMPS